MPLGDVNEQGSDQWWLHRLWRKMHGRMERLERLDAYFRGEQRVLELSPPARQVFEELLHSSRSNFAELVSEAPRERMQPIGIRTAPSQGDSGDQEAWQLWRAVGLEVEAADVHQMMLALSDGYVIVGWDDEEQQPVVTAEDPRQVVTIHDPRQQRKVLAAAKFFHDREANRDYAYLYLPGRVRVAVFQRRGQSTRGMMPFSARTWVWADELPEVDPDSRLGGELPSALSRRVPVVRFRNKRGVGEFEPHTDILDRINRKMLRELVIETFQAFKQKAVMGELPPEDDQGNPIDWNKELESGPDAMWLLPPDVKIWESGQVDLSGILNSVKADVLFLAAVTRTPLSLITPDAAAQSAEGAQLQREGLVFKVEDRITRASAGWAQVVSLMYAYLGDAERGKPEAIEMLWAPTERYSLAEKGSAWSQMQTLPFATKLREVLQYGPDEAARVMSERQDDLLQQALAAQQAAPQPPAVPAGATGG